MRHSHIQFQEGSGDGGGDGDGAGAIDSYCYVGDVQAASPGAAAGISKDLAVVAIDDTVLLGQSYTAAVMVSIPLQPGFWFFCFVLPRTYVRCTAECIYIYGMFNETSCTPHLLLQLPGLLILQCGCCNPMPAFDAVVLNRPLSLQLGIPLPL